MIRPEIKPPSSEPAAGRPVASEEKRRLWERLNPLHRKQLGLLARALLLRQEKARLPEEPRSRLPALLDEFERLVTRLEQLMQQIAHVRAGVAGRTPPAG